jgi:glycine/D-amino acid oxidase-like deaminating enzyme
MKKYDLIVIGGGVIGTFSAYHALKKGKTVLLLEKDSQPFEASFRNFGQAVPSGQSFNKWFDYGRKSLQIYKDLQSETNISLVPNGSWYLASDDQELTLLEEIQKLFDERGYSNKLHSAIECQNSNPHFKKDYVKGGLNPLGYQNAIPRYFLSLFWAIQSMTSIGYGNIHPAYTRQPFAMVCAILHGDISSCADINIAI